MATEHCFFCGHLVVGEEDPRCERCGAFRAALPEKRIHARCPRCETVRLSPFALGPVAIHVCGRCKGAFLPASEWDALLDVYSHAALPDVVLPDVEQDVASSGAHQPYRTSVVPSSEEPAKPDLAKPVRCPTCELEMERVEFAGISGVTIDVCRSHGVWLDAGEIEGVLTMTNTEGKPIDELVSKDAPRGRVPEPYPSFTDALREPAPRDPASVESPPTPRALPARPTTVVHPGSAAGRLLGLLGRLVRALVA